MKLVISKSRDGKGYYSKIQNDYNGKHTEKYLSLQISKDDDIEYGLYDVDGFLSTYEKKDGTIEFKFVVRNIKLVKKYEQEKKQLAEIKMETNPYKEFGENIEVSEEDLPF